jgi:hypothetical protein
LMAEELSESQHESCTINFQQCYIKILGMV